VLVISALRGAAHAAGSAQRRVNTRGPRNVASGTGFVSLALGMALQRGRLVVTISLVSLVALGAAACGDSVDGLAPVGGAEPSAVELERFVRRLHLDLTGQPASDEFLAESVAELEKSADGASAARGALADRLIESEEFAQVVADELSNRAFGGENPENRYDLLCGVTRDEDPACAECGPPADGDPCADCDCERVTAYRTDRQAVRDAAAELAAGTITTAEVDRRFAESSALSAFSTPDALADQLFELFLGRPAEADEQANVEAMILGSVVPDSPAGLLFHRHGSNYQDLLDILFESEVYREAAVSAVFSRYLGRSARLSEMAHFSAELDADRPDVRPVVRAVASSQEYFDQ
jgi:hypothetical protein